MSIALVVILLLGGGTTFVAQNALPGDALYSVKVGVNENIGGMFAFSSESQANLAAKLANRRLDEAEKLANEGRLNAEARAEIVARFEKHSADFATRITELRDKQEGEAAGRISADFEAALSAHAMVLAKLSSDNVGASADVEALLNTLRTNTGGMGVGGLGVKGVFEIPIGDTTDRSHASTTTVETEINVGPGVERGGSGVNAGGSGSVSGGGNSGTIETQINVKESSGKGN